MFDHISKHFEVRQKYSAACNIFNSILGVWKCGQTRSFVFDMLNKQLDFLIVFTVLLMNGMVYLLILENQIVWQLLNRMF